MNDTKNPLKILAGTINETLDSKKWLGSYVAAIFAAVLHLYFGVSIENALLLASPISLGVLSQAHVDGKTAQAKGSPPIEGVGGNVTVVQPAAPAKEQGQ